MKINLTLEKSANVYRVSIGDGVYHYSETTDGILRVVVSVLGREIFERTFENVTHDDKEIERMREAFLSAVEEVRDAIL